MRIDTQRFGTLQINPDELFLFPQGLIGMESLRQWALLPDFDNPAVAWLQSASRGDRAIPLISPRAFFECKQPVPHAVAADVSSPIPATRAAVVGWWRTASA